MRFMLFIPRNGGGRLLYSNLLFRVLFIVRLYCTLLYSRASLFSRMTEEAGNSSNPLRRLSPVGITTTITEIPCAKTFTLPRRSKSSNALPPCNIFVTRVLSSDAPQLFHLNTHKPAGRQRTSRDRMRAHLVIGATCRRGDTLYAEHDKWLLYAGLSSRTSA